MLEWVVLIAVLSLVVFSLFRVHVLLALILSGIIAGLASGLSFVDTLSLFIEGMGGDQAKTALSYILLGGFAVAINYSGITMSLVNILTRHLSNKRGILLLSIAFISSLSQNVVPIHIAFIPLLIPPLLSLFDRMQLDRRAVASALTFGLEAPYIMIPVGYGLIFQKIIQENMKLSGQAIELGDVSLAMLVPGLGMIVGLIVSIFITYRKPRELNIKGYEPAFYSPKEQDSRFTIKHTFTLISILLALVIQIFSGELIIGALVGILAMFVFGVVPYRELDRVMTEGIKMMATIGFVMIVAGGFSHLLKEVGAVDALITQTEQFFNLSKVILILILLLVGLVITIGIGSSFATIPILAVLYVPFGLQMGLSPMAIAVLIGTAGALGDAGSPVSDTTLGPTSGLNADGKHDHIWDTCVPTFIHYNIPLIIFGLIGALIL
jgi:hypothetical protein